MHATFCVVNRKIFFLGTSIRPRVVLWCTEPHKRRSIIPWKRGQIPPKDDSTRLNDLHWFNSAAGKMKISIFWFEGEQIANSDGEKQLGSSCQDEKERRNYNKQNDERVRNEIFMYFITHQLKKSVFQILASSWGVDQCLENTWEKIILKTQQCVE